MSGGHVPIHQSLRPTCHLSPVFLCHFRSETFRNLESLNFPKILIFYQSSPGSPGTTSFLQKVTLIRAAATGGFFLSIPLFLAAIVLYTFTHLSFAVPALVTTAIVGMAIIFGGCAMVYHVFTWQKVRKTGTTISLIPTPHSSSTTQLSPFFSPGENYETNFGPRCFPKSNTRAFNTGLIRDFRPS